MDFFYYNHYIFVGWQHWGQVIGNPLYLSPIYNGDGLIMVENNPDLAFFYPKEGTNIFVDSVCIPVGCQNKEAQDFNYGQRFNQLTVQEIMEALEPEWIDGLTIFGGEPLDPENILHVENLCMMVRDKYPNKTIWLYTGYVWNKLVNNNILNYIDVLVDGPYVEELRNLTLAFRGSSNQRIIDVPKSLKEGKVVLYEFDSK